MRILIALLLFTSICFAEEMKNPPPVKDTGLYDYLLTVKDKINRLRVLESDPDNSAIGRVGDMVLFKDGSTFYLDICISASSSRWYGIKLRDL